VYRGVRAGQSKLKNREVKFFNVRTNLSIQFLRKNHSRRAVKKHFKKNKDRRLNFLNRQDNQDNKKRAGDLPARYKVFKLIIL